MGNKRGRPPIDDRAALRRVAEHIVDANRKGAPCSSRAAILRTSSSVAGNSSDAVLWRLQRKWRSDGPALLAEARERQAVRCRTVSAPAQGYLLENALTKMMRRTVDEDALMRAARATEAFESAMLGPAQNFEKTTRAVRDFEEAMRPFRALDEALRPLRLQQEMIQRHLAASIPAHALEDVVRAVRGW